MNFNGQKIRAGQEPRGAVRIDWHEGEAVAVRPRHPHKARGGLREAEPKFPLSIAKWIPCTTSTFVPVSRKPVLKKGGSVAVAV